jgi:HrpA-like RNA helicase
MDWKSEKTVSEEDASRQELLGRLATLRSVMALTTTDILGPNPSIGFESSLRENTVEENAVSSSGDCDNKSRSVYKGSQQQRVDLELKRQFIGARRQSAEYQKFLATRSQLPVFGERERILETIQQSSICLIVGETGSGKSTQTGQFILEEWLTAAEDVSCNIFVTQPRRISAISLAKRVSQEQGELQSIGEKGSLCGYQVCCCCIVNNLF